MWHLAPVAVARMFASTDCVPARARRAPFGIPPRTPPPAIERLTAARGELFQIPLAAASAVLRIGEGEPHRAPFVDSLARLHDHLSSYLASPFYPGEREHFLEVEQAMHELEARVSDFLDHLQAGDSRGAATILRSGISPAAARADRALEYLVAFNAEQQHRLAMEIPKQRGRGDRVGYVLEAMTAILGLILMGLVMRAIRQYARLLRARNILAIDHAQDVAGQQSGGDRRGSGLGLYIAKGIVEAHGGGIWIDSAQGRGTTIHFSLPVLHRADPQMPASDP